MTATPLGDAERLITGFTHKYTVSFRDLYTTAATSLAVVLDNYIPGQMLADAAYRIATNFDGGATSALTMKVGWNGGTTDDDDGAITSAQVHEDATEVPYGKANGAMVATLTSGYMPLDSGTWEALFTATGANLDALTSGSVHVYLKIVNMNLY